MAFIKEESEDIKMVFIKEESEDIKMVFTKEEIEEVKIEETFKVKHEDTEEHTDLMALKEERQELNEMEEKDQCDKQNDQFSEEELRALEIDREEEDVAIAQQPEDVRMRANTNWWCECGGICQPMPTEIECLCCGEWGRWPGSTRQIR
ncbi:gastrula zinc finger protein XlCGF8.2DB-like [Pimephales promelas]|nr:gastrula zinc finger protein XlCGF8.2DB-like [Pimephales promelas]